ncbi:MAG: tRNA (guanosine(37)-N1)-methyltransferase TrmD [Oscillospiraceae bacterium]|nr:tRNA (guanosine(37)-N1)-methyltransferase TrmD [Oscillospiraceae bacterium]
MKIDILTLFPEMCEEVLKTSIIGRAKASGLVDIECHNIRDYTDDKHRHVDDTPYGGGTGMIMQAQPIYDCYMDVTKGRECHFVYMTPQGKTLTQEMVRELSTYENIVVLCGHYEGVDERVIDELAPMEISIGDYVLTGGELPALVLCDSVCRMLPGVLRNEEAFEKESHFSGLLEYPQYTRPPVWHDRKVPDVLLSGHHQNIEKWQNEQSISRTKEKRPDLYDAYISQIIDKK